MIQKEEFYFDSRDQKNKIHAIKWVPEVEKPVCIFQIVHGMAEHIDRYDEFARFLAGKGILVVGDDHLGHGKSVPEGGTYGYFCEDDAANVLVRDVHRLKKIMQEQYPGVLYLIMGHSMGSFILRNYLFRYGNGVNGAIIAGTGMQSKATLFVARMVTAIQKFFCGPKHVGKFIDKASFGHFNDRFMPVRTQCDWLSRDEANVDRYMADPLCGFVFTLNGFAALFQLIHNCYDVEKIESMPKHLPVFLIAGADDPVGNYGKSIEKVYNSFKEHGMQNVQMKLYEKDRHELLNETDREQVYGDIYRWILQRIA
ncbi:MAG: alpha/beta hydrolase [Roseburia sp.]|nr:alpha/beta hydrolase [Ruminococcus sp.]MCM1155428.1 alpha/beta hydrolase [Roseburia sp.]MCM1243699.1 alpha/beta hydrolase [Roseburia sp.]